MRARRLQQIDQDLRALLEHRCPVKNLPGALGFSSEDEHEGDDADDFRREALLQPIEAGWIWIDKTARIVGESEIDLVQ